VVVTPSVIFLDGGKLLINGVEWDPSKSILIGLGSWTLDCSGLVGGDFDPGRVIIIGPDGIAHYGLVTSISFDHGGTYQVILKIWDRNLGRYVTKVFTFLITPSSPAECPIVSVGLEFHPETRTLTWTTANATTLTASGSWSGNKSLTERSAVITGNGTYVLKGTNACGNEATTTLVVTNFPDPCLTVTTPFTVDNENDLVWGSGGGATACQITGPEAVGTVGPTGSHHVNTAGTYSLVCSNPCGNSSAVVTVTVPTIVQPGAPVVHITFPVPVAPNDYVLITRSGNPLKATQHFKFEVTDGQPPFTYRVALPDQLHTWIYPTLNRAWEFDYDLFNPGYKDVRVTCEVIDGLGRTSNFAILKLVVN
jgi:hypothetical protein